MTRLNEKQEALVKEIIKECRTPAEVTNPLKRLFAGTLEQILQSEMDKPLGCNMHSPEGDNSGNGDVHTGHRRPPSDLYGADRSATLISRITDKIIPDPVEVQSRTFIGICERDKRSISENLQSTLCYSSDAKIHQICVL